MKKIKELNGIFDLSKKYPDYINKKVFRGAFLIIFVLFSFCTILEYRNNPDPFNYFYVSCPINEPVCVNPFYVCPQTMLFGDDCISNINLPKGVCNYGYCDKPFLTGGESYGVNPPFWLKHGVSLLFIILGLAFLVNHGMYETNKELKK